MAGQEITASAGGGHTIAPRDQHSKHKIEAKMAANGVKSMEVNFNFEYVDYRLDEWGKWGRSGNPNIGYSHLSNIGKIMESGGVFVQKGRESERAYTNPQAEETDQLVGVLAKHFPREAETLKDYYIDGKPTNFIAKKQKTAIRTVQFRLKTAKIWLDGRFSLSPASAVN